MDERKLEALFQETVQAAPPASFDEKDVIRGARRVTARRRMAAAGGSLVAATVLAGGISVGTGLVGSDDGQVLSAPPPAQTQQGPQIQADPPSPRTGGPAVLSERGGSGDCGPPDAKLAEALAGTLPEAGGPIAAVGECPSGARSAGFVLRDGQSAGSVSVILSPAGTPPPEQARPESSWRPDGASQVTSKARSGKTLVVVSDPDAGSPRAPYDGRLPALARDLAGKF